MQIKKFKPVDHMIKALIYGPAGCGKTVFGGSAQDAIFASAEGGLLSIADKEPSYVEIKSIKDLQDLYVYLKNEDHGFRTIIIDSITEINEIIKLEIEKETGHSMQLQDWGTLSKKIRSIFRNFRDLPMNVVFIAQEQYITDEDKIKKIAPSLNGKAATEIAYFMDIVGYVNVEADGTRWIETKTNKRLLTKDRSKLIGNDTKMDFAEWEKKIRKMETGEQEVTTDYEAPQTQKAVQAQKPAPQAPKAKPAATPAKPAEPKKDMVSPKVHELQTELKNRGAKNKAEALALLEKLTGGLFNDFDMSDDIAERLLVEMLKEKPKPATKKKSTAAKKKPAAKSAKKATTKKTAKK